MHPDMTDASGVAGAKRQPFMERKRGALSIVQRPLHNFVDANFLDPSALASDKHTVGKTLEGGEHDYVH